MSRKTNLIIITLTLSVVILVGFGLRVVRLGKAGLAFDEGFHVVAAKSIVETGEPTLPSGKPYRRALLFTKVVAFSFYIFGINETAARLPSVVFGTLTILLAFFVGRSLFGTMVGLITAIIVALSPFEVAWSRECRMYAMFQFFFFCGFYAFYRGFEGRSIEKDNQKGLVANIQHPGWMAIISSWRLNWYWLIASVCLIYISYMLQHLTVFFGLSVFIYCLFMGISVIVRYGLRDFMLSKYCFALAAVILSAILFIWAVPSMIGTAKHLLFFSPNWASGRKFMPFFYAEFLASTPIFPVGVFFILGAIQVVTHGKKPGIYTLICVALQLVIISLFFSELGGRRYIYNIFVLIILIASYSVNQFIHSESQIIHNSFDQARFARYKTIGVGLLIPILLIAFSSSFVLYGYRVIIDYYGKEGPLSMEHNDWRAAHDIIASESQPSDIVIPSNPIIADFYGFSNIKYIPFKKNEDYQLFNIKSIPDLKAFKQIVAENRRGWIVTDPDRFHSHVHTDKDVREFIEHNLNKHKTPSLMRLIIFSWNENLVMK